MQNSSPSAKELARDLIKKYILQSILLSMMRQLVQIRLARISATRNFTD
jgi:hypothetical protein